MTARSKSARRVLAYSALATTILCSQAHALGPYDEAGHPSSAMLAWATDVAELVRGPMAITQPELGDASFGDESLVVGPAQGDINWVLSLGDGGSVTLHFSYGIEDGAGDDFAVYENGFFESEEGMFAEFAFVEVSSDGQSYARFDSDALQATAVPGFAVVDPWDYYNLAGDQPRGLGTGFDLSELTNHPLVLSGDLDLADVGYVRLIDVIGNGSTFDADGDPVYDPFATPFDAGGFDLDGVGVLNPVPEPDIAVLLGTGALWLLASRNRRCKLAA